MHEFKGADRVVVSGMGVLSSNANNLEEFSQSLLDASCSFERMSKEQLGGNFSSVPIAALVQGFSFQNLLEACDITSSIKEEALRVAFRSSMSVQTAVLSAIQAWQQAKLHDSGVPSDRIGIVVACDNSMQQLTFDALNKYNQSPAYLSPKFAIQAMASDHLGVLSQILGIHGEGLVVQGASASGNSALIKAWQMIKGKVVDVCIVVGALSELSPMGIQAFINMGAMADGRKFADLPKKASRPFDRGHNGFVYGQGSACMVLESYSSAIERKIKGCAEILSGVSVLDGNASSNPDVQGEMRAMRRCMTMAELKPNDIDYINAHGSSSVQGDHAEVEAIKQVFGKSLDKIWINSTKSIVGHCLFSAGIVEAVATVTQMTKGFIHANRNLDHPIDEYCRFVGQKSLEAKIDTALSNSFGFSGINTCVAFGKI